MRARGEEGLYPQKARQKVHRRVLAHESLKIFAYGDEKDFLSRPLLHMIGYSVDILVILYSWVHENVHMVMMAGCLLRLG